MWKANETKLLLRFIHQSDDFGIAEAGIQSVVNRLWYAGFHAEKVKEAFDVAFGADGDGDEDLFAQLIKQPDGEERFHRCMFEVGAHVTACLHSLHASAETFAFTAYFSLPAALRGAPILDASSVTVGLVVKQLEKQQPTLSLAHSIAALTCDGDFIYLDALVCHGKHRSLIRPNFRLTLNEIIPRSEVLVFQPFSYGKPGKRAEPYPQVAIESFIEREHARLTAAIDKAGESLHELLSSVAV